mgnify:CR=1 FL=1
MNLHIALVHHPVINKVGEEVTTAVTNLDVHDLARSAKTYGAKTYFIVSPISAQKKIVDRILQHWREGAGLKRVPQRGVALALVKVVESLEAAKAQLDDPIVVATAANPRGRKVVSVAEARERLRSETRPTLLLFGTGHGLADSVLDGVDYLLEPIRFGTYNHLSVRAAAAITLDRLVGESQREE